MAGMIQTVSGKINATDVGRTLTHEHFSLDYTNFYVPPPDGIKEFLEKEITLQNIGFIQRYPYSNKSNLSFYTNETKSAVVEDIRLFQKFGGSAIVENTSLGLKRDLAFLKEVANKTGIFVIAGTGFYLADVQPNFILNKNVEELCDIIRTDLTVGCPELNSVKCGVIGEVASNYPFHPFEKKAIQATGAIQEQLKCPVTFHPGRHIEAPSEILRVYTEAGGDGNKAVMSHIERTLTDNESILSLANEYKCYLQQDLFGTEILTYQFNPSIQMPSDTQRILTIKTLISEGYLEKILVSHDIHTKHRLAYYGGHGYFHLFCNIIPKMKMLGISDSCVDEITINNPRKWLTWNP